MVERRRRCETRRRAPIQAMGRASDVLAPMVGMVRSSLVVVAVIAILNSQIGRDIEDDLSAPARTLIAAPAVIAAVVAFCASMLALLPEYRRPRFGLPRSPAG